MLKYLRKNQKQILAVFTVFLMIVFVIQLAPNGLHSGGSGRIAGTIGSTKISATDITNSIDQWQLLRQLQYIDPNNPEQRAPFLETVLDKCVDPISRSSFDFYLLTREAKDRGIYVSDEDVQFVITNNLAGVPDQYAGTDTLKDAVSNCIAVRYLLDQASDVVKITRPFRRLALAREYQEFSLNLINFPATGYLDKVPTPTDEAVRNQFDTFKDELPGAYGSGRNPLGFGYKTPNRVRIQYIEITAADITNAAKNSKTQQDWAIEAYTLFKGNRDYFDSLPVVLPATQPTTNPSSLKPAPHKLNDLDKDFALHLNLVQDTLYHEAEFKISQDALKKISDALISGYGAYRNAQAPSTTAPSSQPSVVTGPAGEYITDHFLENLAKSVQTQFGFLPRVVDGNGPYYTTEQLAALENIGDAVYSLPNGQRVSFPEYAMFVGPLLDENMQHSPMALAPWQPSSPLSDMQRNVFIFRVNGYNASHVPNLDDVRAQVLNDCKLASAYSLATNAARAALAETKKTSLQNAAESAGRSITATSPFIASEVLSEYTKSPGIPPLNLRPISAKLLAVAAQSLMVAPIGADGKPSDLAELYPDALATVIELKTSRPLWLAHGPGSFEGQIMYDASTQLKKDLQVSYCDYNAVAARMNFKPLENGG